MIAFYKVNSFEYPLRTLRLWIYFIYFCKGIVHYRIIYYEDHIIANRKNHG